MGCCSLFARQAPSLPNATGNRQGGIMRAARKQQQRNMVIRAWWLWLLTLLLLTSCGLAPPPAGPPVWPTPVPPPPAYPTMEPKRWLGGSDPHATFQLPGTTFDVHLAVHPTQGWPAV